MRAWQRDTVKILVVALLVFVLITAALYLYVFRLAGDASPFGYSDWRSLQIGLLSSAIFGATVGVTSVLVTLFRPEEDSLDKRLGYLYPLSTKLNPEARAQLANDVLRLAAPAIRAKVEYILHTYDDELGAFWISCHGDVTLKNVLMDEEYVDKEVEISLEPDIVKPRFEPLGKIHEVALIVGSSRETLLRDEEVRTTDLRFRRFVPVRIPPAAEANYYYHLSAWAKTDVPWCFSSQRFMQGIEFKLRNRTDKRIACTLYHATNDSIGPAREVGSKRLAPDESQILKAGLSLPGRSERFELRFLVD